MPMEYDRYPSDWKAIALQVKQDAGWICQHCSKPCRKPKELVADFEKRLGADWQPQLTEKLADYENTGVLKYKPKRFLLTVAHLDQEPSNIAPENLKALCAPCHLRFDVKYRGYNRRRLRERRGQLRLFAEHSGDGQP
jgi:5-methylcytosine-specific restriction endonuclease McrA